VTPKKLVLLTAVVAGLLAFIVLFERKMPSTADRQRKGDLYWDIAEERVTGLTLVRGTETLEFTRPFEGAWRMVKPSAYPADPFAVNGAAAEVTDLKRSGNAADDARPSDFGLDAPVAAATLVWTDSDDPERKKTRTIEFGKALPGTDVTAARVQGQTKVLFVPSAVLAAVRKPADDFRSRDLFQGPAAQVSRLEILRGRGSLVLARREGVWWLSEPLADLADAAAADRLVGQLTALRARDFIHTAEDLAALSLNPPSYRVSLTGEKGTVTSADFGATRSDGDTVYARRDGQVVTVERDIVDELSKEAEPFRSTALVAFNHGDVTAVDAVFGKQTYALVQANGGWSSGGRAVTAPAADDALNVISGLKGRGFVDEATAKALTPATATVSLKVKNGSGWTIAFHPRGVDSVATVSSRPGGIVVPADAADRVAAALAKAVLPPTPGPPKKPTKAP
jgi:hypothetical protein